MPQTRFAQTVCHFSHNADFDQLRISKYPANAHEINYFSMLVVGDFKHTGRVDGWATCCRIIRRQKIIDEVEGYHPVDFPQQVVFRD